MSRKSKKVEKVTLDRRSQIIELSVRYLQSVAANDAGFAGDPTGNCQFASRNRLLLRAERCLLKLIGLGPLPGAKPLCVDELRAKAAVLKELYGFRSMEELNETERAFSATFAAECVQALEKLAFVPLKGGAAS